ncbi:DUF72 domain-containing protein [Phormidium sp. CCY1219]|uniref:DUF72 domain-containing protein n=1 Tax=Phormidium sp. CCY1219 TaxID=2886104 RepID=UPI002D1E8177|nr:DUF72 domain-containing protein [Phormidium sp. CCY1219]MEB3827409.1 DUF72 domain-containing protein [Phormidium sp. CCY1219]
MTSKSNRIHIGTSGWHYAHWRSAFYPEDIAKRDWLNFYADRLPTVEINNSFYKLPSPETLREWRDTVPKEFVFAVKGSRYITHQKNLKDPEQTLEKFMDRVQVIEEKLGVILFQLPPHWHYNGERLRNFIERLPQQYRYGFEFRDRSWFNEEVYTLLSECGMAFCIYELAGERSPKTVTADFVYLRLHGPDGAYRGEYDTNSLCQWAEEFANWTKQGKEVYCYFDNDEAGYAARNAIALQDIVLE